MFIMAQFFKFGVLLFLCFFVSFIGVNGDCESMDCAGCGSGCAKCVGENGQVACVDNECPSGSRSFTGDCDNIASCASKNCDQCLVASSVCSACNFKGGVKCVEKSLCTGSKLSECPTSSSSTPIPAAPTPAPTPAPIECASLQGCVGCLSQSHCKPCLASDGINFSCIAKSGSCTSGSTQVDTCACADYGQDCASCNRDPKCTMCSKSGALTCKANCSSDEQEVKVCKSECSKMKTCEECTPDGTECLFCRLKDKTENKDSCIPIPANKSDILASCTGAAIFSSMRCSSTVMVSPVKALAALIGFCLVR